MDTFRFILPLFLCFSLKVVKSENLLFPPTIIENPVRTTVFTGQKDLELACGAEGPNGNPSGPGKNELDYQWYRRKDSNTQWEEVPIVGDDGWAWQSQNDNGNIRVKAEIIDGNTKSFEGEYQCVVSLNNRFRVKSTIGRFLYHRVRIDATPESRSVKKNDHLQINPIFLTVPCKLLQCQNFKLKEKPEGSIDVGILDPSRMVIDYETGHFIIMKSADIDNNKQFYIQFGYVEANIAYTSKPQNVKIQGEQTNLADRIVYNTPYPTNSANPNGFHRFKGDEIFFTCAVEGKNTLPKPNWEKDDGDLPSKVDTSNPYRIKIGNLEPSDSGTYKCSISNNDFKEFKLKVEETLDFSEKLQNKNISVGDVNVKWSCKGTEGSNDVEFLVNGEKPGPDYYISGDEMTLNEVKSTHGGVVQCNVEKSSTEEEISSSAYFVVFKKTRITSQNEAEINVTKDMGEVKLFCEIEADDRIPFTMEWFKDKVKLEIDGSTFKLEQGDKKSNLIIDAKSSSIFGKYECVAKNELTESRTGEILLYQGIPTPAPVNTTKSAFPWWIFAIIAGALIFFIIVLCVCLYIQRNKGEEYKIDALERKQGLDPEADLRAEDFKVYQRPDDSKPLYDEPFKIHTSEESLEEYGEEIREDGSFIGAYKPSRNNYKRDTDV